MQQSNGLSTLATIVAQFGDCCQKRRLSPNGLLSATVAKTGDCCRFWRQSPNSATVAGFSNSRRIGRQIVAEIGDYSLQCGQGLRVDRKEPTNLGVYCYRGDH